MSEGLTFFMHNPIAMSPGVPAGFSGKLLPGAQVMSCVEEAGTIIVQEFKSDQFIIRYHIFEFAEKMTLRWFEEKEGLSSYTALTNDLRYKLKDIGKIHLRTGQFKLVYTLQTECAAEFGGGKQYGLFDVSYSPGLLQELGPFFSSLDELVNKMPSSASFSFGRQNWMHPHMTDIIRNILHSPYETGMQQLYFEIKVKEFLLLMLTQSGKDELVVGALSRQEIASVYEVRNIILNNIEKHFTIQHISRQVNLNEFKLKTGFKQVFGTGVFECLLNARMQKAKMLLLETDKPVKEIASLSGYERIPSFITAFRKHFGQSPGSLRKNKY